MSPVRPLEVLIRAAAEDVGRACRALRAEGWDAAVTVSEAAPGRAEVVLVVALPEVLVPVEAVPPVRPGDFVRPRPVG
jgi:hypothetical protein